jgi:hypothetical protein
MVWDYENFVPVASDFIWSGEALLVGATGKVNGGNDESNFNHQPAFSVSFLLPRNQMAGCGSYRCIGHSTDELSSDPSIHLAEGIQDTELVLKNHLQH